jgi:hypothetical protein
VADEGASGVAGSEQGDDRHVAAAGRGGSDGVAGRGEYFRKRWRFAELVV